MLPDGETSVDTVTTNRYSHGFPSDSDRGVTATHGAADVLAFPRSSCAHTLEAAAKCRSAGSRYRYN